MRSSEFEGRMWAEAVALFERAERLKRQFFLPPGSASGSACWAPPLDVFETAMEFVALVALPDVDPAHIELSFADGVLVVAGERRLPIALAGAAIRRLEIPQGRFERRLALPARSLARSEFRNGCLLVVLEK
ncbi:MAG TPA: Hsp20/alpha crystallin family protein [Gammaproteobacteria bacterium]|nr:Hsp20/alpha crystallin family protein [Gammaproteobacteria bacterium]